MSDGPGWPDPERVFHKQRAQAGHGRRRGVPEGLLLLFGLLLSALTLEGLARVAMPARPTKGGYSPVRGHRSREPMNTAGYRDVEHTKEKPPGIHRMLFLGDSFTYGVGVLLDDTYPKRTERALSVARSEPWESIVMAVPGIGTPEEATILRNEGIAYSPDLVVLGYVLNDAEGPNAAEVRRAADWTAAENARQNPPWWSRSALLGFIQARLHATSENRQRIANHLALYQEGSPGFVSVQKSIGEMAALCRERGVPFVVVVFPLFANPLDDSYPFASIHAKIEAICKSQGIHVVDLLPYYKGMDWRLLVVEGERDEHPNELANRIAAQALTASLESSMAPRPKAGAAIPPEHQGHTVSRAGRTPVSPTPE